MEIGKKLKNARIEAGLTQEKAAEKIDVSRQTISNWENEKSYPDIISVIALSDLYSVSLDELLKGDQKMAEHLDCGQVQEIDASGRTSGREYKCCKKQQKTDWSNSFKYYTDDIVDCAEHAVAGRNLLSGNCILCGNHEFIGIALSDYQTDLGGRLLWDGIK